MGSSEKTCETIKIKGGNLEDNGGFLGTTGGSIRNKNRPDDDQNQHGEKHVNIGRTIPDKLICSWRFIRVYYFTK